MRRTVMAAVGVGIVALAIGGTGWSSASPRIQSTTTMHLVAKTLRGTVVDVQARGPSLGDQEVTSGAVLDSNGHKIGHFANICTLVEAGRNPLAQCITTGRLSSGQVTLQGLTRLAAANATA